jgi:hypothetical protein
LFFFFFFFFFLAFIYLFIYPPAWWVSVWFVGQCVAGVSNGFWIGEECHATVPHASALAPAWGHWRLPYDSIRSSPPFIYSLCLLILFFIYFCFVLFYYYLFLLLFLLFIFIICIYLIVFLSLF